MGHCFIDSVSLIKSPTDDGDLKTKKPVFHTIMKKRIGVSS